MPFMSTFVSPQFSQLLPLLYLFLVTGNGAEFVAVDAAGNMYGGEPAPGKLQKYERIRR